MPTPDTSERGGKVLTREQIEKIRAAGKAGYLDTWNPAWDMLCDLALSAVDAPAAGVMVPEDVKERADEVIAFMADSPQCIKDKAHAWVLARYILQSASTATALPDGWVMVPREATLAMVEAGNEALDADSDMRTGYEKNDVCRIVYRAMLAAAPNAGDKG